LRDSSGAKVTTLQHDLLDPSRVPDPSFAVYDVDLRIRSADLVPVGYVAREYVASLIHCQIADAILWIDDDGYSSTAMGTALSSDTVIFDSLTSLQTTCQYQQYLYRPPLRPQTIRRLARIPVHPSYYLGTPLLEVLHEAERSLIRQAAALCRWLACFVLDVHPAPKTASAMSIDTNTIG